MAAFCKKYTNILGIYLIQKVMQYYERRSALCIFKICGYAFVKFYISL
jgi:hypothetical protein